MVQKLFVIFVHIYSKNLLTIKPLNNQMAKQDSIKIEGKVIENLSNSVFKVEMDNGHILQCHISGKLRMHNIRIMVGDYVEVEVSPYDLTMGRICYRKKNRPQF